jgi:hypothetical protein
LRIPISGLNSLTPELARILKHELAHSFINQLSAGRCPLWLHEGIAQFLEPKNLGGDGHQFAQLFKSQKNIPLNALEGSFMRLSGAEAYVALCRVSGGGFLYPRFVWDGRHPANPATLE